MMSMLPSVLRTLAVLGMNFVALNSTQPSAAFVMINTIPFLIESLRSFAAYSSISSSLFWML